MLPRNTRSFTGVLFQTTGAELLINPVGEDRNLLLEFYAPSSFEIPKPAMPTAVYTHCAVNSNSGQETWYAFSTFAELDFFRTLLLVDRMGPKSAFKVLNSTPWVKIQALIAANDREGFKKLKGIPEKSGEDCVSLVFSTPAAPAKTVTINEDAVAALCALGWKHVDAKKAAQAAQEQLKSNVTEDLIKACLKRK
jgi:Holliday junction DNA helicase RuvA